MLTSATKRFILPFTQTTSLSEVETAAVYAVAETERSRGGGLISKQPEEKIVFISKMGYPLWLFPGDGGSLVFDGLGDAGHSVSYAQVPSAKTFMENLEANLSPREKYMKFLSDYTSFFNQSIKQNQFAFKGLITDLDFRREFNVYRRQAAETAAPVNLALLSPTLDESEISNMLKGLEQLESSMREDAQRLPEGLRLLNKTTGQYVTELDFEASAAAEEIDAKIRATQELVNPQVASLNKAYKIKIKGVTESFDKELEALMKLKAKTEKYIETNQQKIRLCEKEAKAQGKKGHILSEKRWKEKNKQTQKELGGLKKELKKIEDILKKITKQKSAEISKLYGELDAEVKFARQPLIALETAREAKLRVFKQETQRLLALEKPVVEGAKASMKLREEVNASFQSLGISELQLKSPALFYVPFYAVCYEMGLSRRYLILPPSISGTVDFSAKLKGALGLSKTKDLLVPRFKATSALICKVEALAKQNAMLERQLCGLGERNNLLKNSLFLENVSKGLGILRHEGWFSEKEHQVLGRQLMG